MDDGFWLNDTGQFRFTQALMISVFQFDLRSSVPAWISTVYHESNIVGTIVSVTLHTNLMLVIKSCQMASEIVSDTPM